LKNLHTKPNQYSQKCDEAFLSKHLKRIVEEASSSVLEVNPSELKNASKELLLIDVRV